MRILLFTNPSRDENYLHTARAAGALLAAGAEVFAPADSKAAMPEGGRLFFYTGSGPNGLRPDIVVALGGDGTFLRAARDVAAGGIPVLGVNLGSLGFLTGLDLGDIGALSRLVTGEYETEDRMMLSAELFRNGERIFSGTALNDCIIGRGASMRNIRLCLYSDENNVMNFGGDGVIVATPTGSTAYSMAAGGPVVDPGAECMVVTPICAHALYARSIVLEARRTVSVEVAGLSDRDAYLSCDGDGSFPLMDGDLVRVFRSAEVTRIVKLNRDCFFCRLRERLG